MVLWPPSGRHKNHNKYHRRCRFLYDEKVDHLCACIDLNNQFDIPKEGYCFSTGVSNSWYIVPFLDLTPHSFQKLMAPYRTVADSTFKENNETFRGSDGLSDIFVYFIITTRQDGNGFRLGFTFDTLPWSLKKPDSIVVGRVETEQLWLYGATRVHNACTTCTCSVLCTHGVRGTRTNLWHYYTHCLDTVYYASLRVWQWWTSVMSYTRSISTLHCQIMKQYTVYISYDARCTLQRRFSTCSTPLTHSIHVCKYHTVCVWGTLHVRI